ncbi:hypothetical protein QWZ13_14210 [Reinekea marina]|uniref:hypothetical protein n=1 Tax=Reinekea marina TaxID=1310421 RepID=UPI0025B35C20|nr:hypothetical protein [Reinekea marina]MDN3650070.1 hypothetical protein [Reinekea marina]
MWRVYESKAHLRSEDVGLEQQFLVRLLVVQFIRLFTNIIWFQWFRKLYGQYSVMPFHLGLTNTVHTVHYSTFAT